MPSVGALSSSFVPTCASSPFFVLVPSFAGGALQSVLLDEARDSSAGSVLSSGAVAAEGGGGDDVPSSSRLSNGGASRSDCWAGRPCRGVVGLWALSVR